MQFKAAIQGTGADIIEGNNAALGTSSLRVNAGVASGQTITFAGSGGELYLSESASSLASFAAPIAGFGAGDGIYIGAMPFSGGPSLQWSQQGTEGTLTVTDGSVTARIVLFGQYAAGGFAVANGDNGTLVTYKPPAQVIAIAHR